jgi:hypothetical protein
VRASGQREYGNVLLFVSNLLYILHFRLPGVIPEVPIETGLPVSRMLPEFACAVSSVQTLLTENGMK